MRPDRFDPRSYCRGVHPLDARLEPWQLRLLRDRRQLHRLVDMHGSPVHLMSTEPFERNGDALLDVADDAGVPLELYFARKANKCLAFAETAARRGWGVDVSSLQETEQALGVGVPPSALMVTAAVKPRPLLERIVERRILTALDNRHEVLGLAWTAAGSGSADKLPVAVRLSGFHHEGSKLHSRFGFDIDEAEASIRELWDHPVVAQHLCLRGLHFHLDGYDPQQRVSALAGTMELVDRLPPELGWISFIDIGGGLPVRYLDDEVQWHEFWEALEGALLGDRDPITYRNHGLGLHAVDGRVVGSRRSYPFAQALDAPAWLRSVLHAPLPGRPSDSVATALRTRGLALRCEPGRSLMDGCGITAARVVWTKDHPDGYRLAGLEMNRTQCRTSSDDFLVDPLIVPRRRRKPDADPRPFYLTGAYCIENEMLCWRALRTPRGLHPEDLVVWPNTAGYFMHFLESRSHQLPIARNLVHDPVSDTFELDAIETVAERGESRGRTDPSTLPDTFTRESDHAGGPSRRS